MLSTSTLVVRKLLQNVAIMVPFCRMSGNCCSVWVRLLNIVIMLNSSDIITYDIGGDTLALVVYLSLCLSLYMCVCK